MLGFEADIYGSLSIGTLYGTEKRLLEIGRKIFFRWNPDLSGVVLESAGIVPAAGTGGSAFESTVLLRIVGSASSCFGSFCATSLAGNSCPRSISSERVFVHFNPFAGGMFECVFVLFERIFPSSSLSGIVDTLLDLADARAYGEQQRQIQRFRKRR